MLVATIWILITSFVNTTPIIQVVLTAISVGFKLFQTLFSPYPVTEKESEIISNPWYQKAIARPKKMKPHIPKTRSFIHTIHYCTLIQWTSTIGPPPFMKETICNWFTIFPHSREKNCNSLHKRYSSWKHIHNKLGIAQLWHVIEKVILRLNRWYQMQCPLH